MTEIEQVIFLKGGTSYEHSYLFVEALSRGFRQLGYATNSVDLNHPDCFKQLETCLRAGPIKFFYSYNGQGVDIRLQEQLLFNDLGIPFVGWFADHPAYHYDRLQVPLEQYVMLFIDQQHVRVAREHIPRPNIKGFFPLGGNQSEQTEWLPPSKREIPLLFVGSFSSPEALKAQRMPRNPFLKKITESVLEIALFNTETDPFALICNQLLDSGIEPADLGTQFVFGLVSFVDQYVRMYRRAHLLSKISTVPVRVYGSGWETCDTLGDNVTLCGPINLGDALEVIANSRMLLNILPNFKSAPHDRIYTGMLQGAAVLTDSNPWLADQLKSGENVLLYDIAGNDLEEQMMALQAHPEQMDSLAAQGQQYARAHHTWEQRAGLLDHFVEAHYFHAQLSQLQATAG